MSLDPQALKSQLQGRTLKAQPVSQDWTGHHMQERESISVLQFSQQRLGVRGKGQVAPPWTALSRGRGSLALTTRQHKQGWEILHLFHSTTGARKRTYSLYEQPKSKINEAKTVTKNSPASEAAVSSLSQLSPASGIAEGRAAGRMAFSVYSGID